MRKRRRWPEEAPDAGSDWKVARVNITRIRFAKQDDVSIDPRTDPVT